MIRKRILIIKFFQIYKEKRGKKNHARENYYFFFLYVCCRANKRISKVNKIYIPLCNLHQTMNSTRWLLIIFVFFLLLLETRSNGFNSFFIQLISSTTRHSIVLLFFKFSLFSCLFLNKNLNNLLLNFLIRSYSFIIIIIIFLYLFCIRSVVAIVVIKRKFYNILKN